MARVKKGDQFTDSDGGVWTVEKVFIQTQTVECSYYRQDQGTTTTDTRTYSIPEWNELIQPVQAAVTPELVLTPGILFQMADKSVWEVIESEDEKISYRSIETQRVATIPVAAFHDLIANKHFKLKSEGV